MATKQSIIDSIHTQLRSSSAHLGEERRRLERLQRLAKERDERKQKISNLRHAADEEVYHLQQLKQQNPHISINSSNGQEMYLGEADTAFSALPPGMNPADILHSPHLASSLPSPAALRARLQAYRENNARLEGAVSELKGRSREVEGKYRKVISLCTKVPEERIDDVLEGLWRAVESEAGDVELGRVREFLGRVEGVE
jgi:regulatory protein SWI6